MMLPRSDLRRVPEGSSRAPVGFTARLLTVLLAVVLAGGAAACTGEGGPGILRDDFPSEGVLYGMRSYLHTQGTRTGVVEADSAYEHPDSSITFLYGMDMRLYHESTSGGARAGEDRARIQADLGRLNQRTEELVATGNVVARVVDQGMEITTSVLEYDPTSERIWSDSATTIRRDDGSVTRGSAFESDLTFSSWKLLDPVGDIPADGGGEG